MLHLERYYQTKNLRKHPLKHLLESRACLLNICFRFLEDVNVEDKCGGEASSGSETETFVIEPKVIL